MSHKLQGRTKSTNNLANTITMVAEPLAPPAVWIWWTHTTGGVDGLAQTLFKAAVGPFSYNQKIKVVINLFQSTDVCS